MTPRQLRLNAGLDPADVALGAVIGEVKSPARWALRSAKPARKQFLAPRLSNPRARRDKDIARPLLGLVGDVPPDAVHGSRGWCARSSARTSVLRVTRR